MIALEHKPRTVVGEVLPPKPWTEADQSLVPVPVRVWYDPPSFRHLVQFEDGGVWALSDRVLQDIHPSDVRANVGEIFARWPRRFVFIRRNRARYGRRT